MNWSTVVPGTAGKAAWLATLAREAVKRGEMTPREFANTRKRLLREANVPRADGWARCHECDGTGLVDVGDRELVCGHCDGLGERCPPPVARCDACGGAGFVGHDVDDINHKDFGRARLCESCKGSGRALSTEGEILFERAFLERCGVPDAYLGVTFDSFEALGPNLDALSAAQHLRARASSLEDWQRGPWGIVLYGGFGVGKTGLSVAACRAAMAWTRPRWVVWPYVVDRIIASYGPGRSETRADILAGLSSVGLLVLDDFGRGTSTTHAAEIAEEVIDLRCSNDRPTILTTNLSIAELGTRYTGRVHSRLQTAEVLDLGHEDLRARAFRV